MNDAKDELINLGLDSTSRFYQELELAHIGHVKFAPCLTEDLYELYKLWCHRTGQRHASMVKLQNTLKLKHEIPTERKRYRLGESIYGPRMVVMLGHKFLERPADTPETDWLGDCIEAFKASLGDYRAEAR